MVCKSTKCKYKKRIDNNYVCKFIEKCSCKINSKHCCCNS